jgi:hypothetical protein
MIFVSGPPEGWPRVELDCPYLLDTFQFRIAVFIFAIGGL